MRLLIVGSLNGQIGAASQIAMARGATVSHIDDVDGALASLRSGQGADLVMADIKLDIKQLIDSLSQERISVPVIGCGIGNDAAAALPRPLPASPLFTSPASSGAGRRAGSRARHRSQ